LLGLLLGLLIIAVLQVTGFAYPGMEDIAVRFNLPARIYPQLSWLSAWIGPAVVFVGTLLAALYPALRLYRLQPLAAMRAN
jgi:ABC-type lipoprotein release transport system permease subunit